MSTTLLFQFFNEKRTPPLIFFGFSLIFLLGRTRPPRVAKRLCRGGRERLLFLERPLREGRNFGRIPCLVEPCYHLLGVDGIERVVRVRAVPFDSFGCLLVVGVKDDLVLLKALLPVRLLFRGLGKLDNGGSRHG